MKRESLAERSLKAVWHPCTQMKQHERWPLVPISRAEGVWLYDHNGNRYLDAIGSWWVNLFGHSNSRINAAIGAQLEKMEHVMLAGFTHEPVVELSERLSRLTPPGLGHCFYASDGASATEIALKMSFHYWQNIGRLGKSDFVSLRNGYHGETLGALSVTGVGLFRDAYAPLLRFSAQVTTPDWRLAGAGESPEEYALRAAEALEAYLAENHAHSAAFIIEPLVQGATGMGMYHPVYLKRAREICDQYEVHLMADEIAVGFGRTGTLFACEQAGITPDILCLGKGLSGGYLPLSTVMTTDEIYRAFYDDDVARGFLHSHTHSGNALACAAALATLDIFEQDGIIHANRRKAGYLSELLLPLAAHPRVRNFRHCGMIWAFDVQTEDPNFSLNFFQAGLRESLSLRPLGNTVYFMPPYTIDESEMNHLAGAVLRTLEAC